MNNIINIYLLMWKKAFDFKSRSRRRDYWGAILCNICIGIFFALLFILAIKSMPGDFSDNARLLKQMGLADYPEPLKIINVLNIAYSIIVFIPTLSLTVRRLHDVGKSGLMLLWLFISYIILTILLAINTQIPDNITIFAALIFFCLFLFVYGLYFCIQLLRNSKQGENKYGISPKFHGSIK